MSALPDVSTPEPDAAGRRSSWSEAELGELLRVAHRMALRWSGSEQDAEDVVQEAMLRLVLSEHIAHPHAWLAVVVRRLVGRLLRRRLRETAVLAELRRPATTARPADGAEARCEIASVLARISAHDGRLLVLDAAGFTDLEISQRVGCRRESVHTLLSRARQRIRRAGAE